jgi:hypothetical protein
MLDAIAEEDRRSLDQIALLQVGRDFVEGVLELRA